MATSLFLLGTNHERAPIPVRERLAITKSELPRALQELVARPAIREAYVLSTCNRTELYIAGDGPQAVDQAAGFLAAWSGFQRSELEAYTYIKTEHQAVIHLFAVAAGANSLIPGDAEILGQVKESFQTAAERETLGKTLFTLVRKAIEAGKLARSATKIGGKAASLSYASVEIIKGRTDIRAARILVVGAGKMGRLLGKILHDAGAQDLLFANRTFDKAQALADELGGRAVQFRDLADHLPDLDIALAVTDAPCFILQRDEIERACRQRRQDGPPLVLVDLGAPRNIDSGARGLPGVRLYDLDDLQKVIESNLEARREELTRVMEIVAEQAEEYQSWLRAAAEGQTIRTLLDLGEAVRQEEVRKMAGKLSHLGPQELRAVDMVTSRIVNRLLHLPISELKAAAASGDGKGLSDAARTLFHLEESLER